VTSPKLTQNLPHFNQAHNPEGPKGSIGRPNFLLNATKSAAAKATFERL
jgi:hypothetical protein